MPLMPRFAASRAPLLTLIVAFAAVYFIWGSTYFAIHLAIDSMPPLLMLSARFGVAGLAMYIWLRLRGKARPSARHWAVATLAGTLMLGIGTGSVAWAEQYISTGLAALLVTTSPIWMVVLDWLWLRSGRPNYRTLIGLVLGCVGIVMLVDPASMLSGEQQSWGAMLLTLVGAFTWAAGSLYVRKAELPRDPFMSTALQMIGGAAGLLLGGLALGEGQQVQLETITWASFAGWSYLVVFGSFVAFSAYVWLLKNVSPAKLATHGYVNPVVAVGLGWLFLGEAVDAQMVLAIAVLLSAVVLINMPANRRTRMWRLRLRPAGLRRPIARLRNRHVARRQHRV